VADGGSPTRLVMINAAGYGAIAAGPGPGDVASQTHVAEASAGS
jgi:hypothetical protein